MAASTARKPRSIGPGGKIEVNVPAELIQARAYQIFLERGASHGSDWEDWFVAESQLKTLFRSVGWTVEESIVEEGKLGCLVIRAVGRIQPLQELRRYFQGLSTTTLGVEGCAARLSVVWPDSIDESDSIHADRIASRKDQIVPKRKSTSTEQLQRARYVRSPVSALSGERFAALKGKLIALLLNGPDKGTVIATAPLDFQHPDKPRKSIREQIAASTYKNRRYQLRQILADSSG